MRAGRFCSRTFIRICLCTFQTSLPIDQQAALPNIGIDLRYLMHCVTGLLERCSYFRCLMIDFSKAFDRVDHPTLLAKLDKLDLPAQAMNCIISYLSGRSQKCLNDVYQLWQKLTLA